MNLIATHLAKRFLKRELIAEESLEWCIYGIEKKTVNVHYMDSFNLIGELLLRLSTNYIFCCLFCYIKKIFKWVPCKNVYPLLIAFFNSPISFHDTHQSSPY